jgi:hypothetical protein
MSTKNTVPVRGAAGGTFALGVTFEGAVHDRQQVVELLSELRAQSPNVECARSPDQIDEKDIVA